MARPFYSAPVKHRPDFPLLSGQARLPSPQVLNVPRPPPPAPGFQSDKPWMTPQLVAEIRRRNQLQNVASRSGAEHDRATAEQQRQLVNRLVNDAKERFCLAHPERTDEILASDRRARPFHCGSCDRNYGSQQQLDEHCREHVRCGLEDCPFTAHPRVVEKHVTMQHQTGLAKVIMALNTPEAIARWREQRRANFCRPESAARRQQQQAERAARGIRLGAGRGRFPPPQERAGRGRGRGARGGSAQWRGRGGRGGGGLHTRPPQSPLSDSDEEEVPNGLPKFAGILAERAAPETGGSDGEDEVSSGVECAAGKGADAVRSVGATADCATEAVRGDVDSTDPMTGCVNLTETAAGDAGLADDAAGSANSTEAMSVDVRGEDAKDARVPSHHGQADGPAGQSVAEAPGESVAVGDLAPAAGETVTDTAAAPTGDRPAAAERGPRADHRDTGSDRGRGGRWRGRGRGQRRGGAAEQPPRKRRRPLTLLEKLLAPDIQRERNIILQCVRYVVNENFFDGRPLSAESPETESDEGMLADTVEPGGVRPCEEAADAPVDERPPEDSTVDQHAADGGRTAGQQGGPAATEPQVEPDDCAEPPPRLLGGAYYDSDAMTDSD